MSLSYHRHSFYNPSSFLLTHVFPLLVNKLLIILLAQTVESYFMSRKRSGYAELSLLLVDYLDLNYLCTVMSLKFICYLLEKTHCTDVIFAIVTVAGGASGG